jgi:methionyl-tRNA formyltransferase
LNLHPSLLPAYRGPAPLFWMARQGETQAGVTLHFLDEGLDTGDSWSLP